MSTFVLFVMQDVFIFDFRSLMGVRFLFKVLNFNGVRRFSSNYIWNCSVGQNFKPGFVILRNMSSDLNPPSSVRGMTNLHKELFDKTVSVPCIIVPISQIDYIRPVLKPYLLKIPNFRPLQEVPEKDASTRGVIHYCEKFSSISTPSKLVVLDPSKIKSYDDMSENHRDMLQELGVTYNDFTINSLTIGYDNWKSDEILRAVIPEEYESVSSYSICGHIIHLNLREHLQDYKKLIGDVLLDKVVNARTVVNKTDNIDTTYRTFSMEVLSGDDDMIATVRENKCRFVFDFSKVYWNSRLSTEHERVVNLIKKGDILYDVFCGVGPFSIPCSKKGCRVLANDLNPESIKWLKESSKINKAEFQIYNKDGKDFILEDVKNDLMKIDENFSNDIHIVMNLPGLAVDFLPTFRGLFDRKESEHISKLPTPQVHVYCFTKGAENPKEAALKLVEGKLDYTLNKDLIKVHFVRNVAPMKEMMRVSFKLSSGITMLSGKHLMDKVTPEEDVSNVKRICSELAV